MKRLKIKTLLLASILALSTFTACSDPDFEDEVTLEIPNGTEETKEGILVETTAGVPSASPESENPAILKVGEYDVFLDEYMYYYNNYKGMLDGGDASVWETNPEMLDIVTQYTMGAIRSTYAVYSLAADNSITLTDEEKASAADSLEQMKVYYGGEEALKEILDGMSMTERYYKCVLEYSTIEQKLYEKLTGTDGIISVSDDEVRANLNENYVRAAHILVKNDDGESAEDNLALANSILAKVNAGDDFMSLVDEYGEDPGMEDNTDGYYFTYNEMVSEFEDAAFALKENETSGIVETSYGYHIIKRLPMEEEYISANFDTFKIRLLEDKYYAVINERASALEVVQITAN